MDINEFYKKVFQVIDSLNPEELKKIHTSFQEKGFYEPGTVIPTESDTQSMKRTVKNGIQKTSIEDVESIMPEQVREIIQEFKNAVHEEDYENQELITSITNQGEETQDDLIREALSISSQRLNNREELPKDLQRRMGYITAKLNVKFKLPKSEITKLTNLNNRTVDKYIADCIHSQPDLIKFWSQPAEAKSIQKIEDTMAKATAGRAITTIQNNISIVDKIREKYSMVAAQRGYNLYSSSSGDLEKLMNSAVQLFFTIDSVYTNIIALENENARLRRQISVLREENRELDELKVLLLT